MPDAIAAQNDKSDLREWWAPDGVVIDPERLDRMRKVAIHWNQLGHGVARTAKELGVSATTIYKDRKALLKAWQMAVQADVVELVARDVHKLEQQEVQLWDAWEKSKEPEVIKTVKRYVDKDGKKGKSRSISTTTINRVPDVKIMDALTRIQERRARLLGFDQAVNAESAAFSLATFINSAWEARQARNAKKPEPLDVTPPEALPAK